MIESEYQRTLIKKIKEMFPGAIVIKNDASYISGIPDITILYNDKWATLEVKASKDSKKRPNQDYYVNKMAALSFSSFIYPENEQEVLDELQRTFES